MENQNDKELEVEPAEDYKEFYLGVEYYKGVCRL